MSAPQQIGVGAPTGRISSVGEQTCRLPSKLPWRWGADRSAISGVGEQTCRLPSISALGRRQVGYLALGSRPVGSPANCRWGADRSVPQKIAVGARHVGSLDTANIYIIAHCIGVTFEHTSPVCVLACCTSLDGLENTFRQSSTAHI